MDYYVKSGSLIAVLLFREKLNREFIEAYAFHKIRRQKRGVPEMVKLVEVLF